MIALIVSMFSTVGAAGFGSALKLIAGYFANQHERKLAEEAAKNAAIIEFQKVFAKGGMSPASAYTRRLLAIIVMSTCAAMAIICVLNPGKEFTTFVIPEAKNSWSILWGFVRFPSHKEITVSLTLGHLALMFMSIGSMTAGFYFTPGGRK